jgi:D-alanyl-D-alanine carboxypeptidase
MRSARLAAAILAVVVSLVAASAAAAGERPTFKGSIQELGPGVREWMTGISWRPSCPVPLDDLRLLSVTHWGFDGTVKRGSLVVHEDVADDVLAVMRRLFKAGFPIRRMVLVDRYGASDFRSIEADNTSAFNCRYVDGTTRWSEHAYGRAIDVNPIENPYVTGGGMVAHDASWEYVDRSEQRKGMALPASAVVRAFAAIGWGWGGFWSGAKDYQHFSASGN